MVGLARVMLLAVPSGALRFANMYGDEMVLASRPQQATVWGYADASDDSVQVCVHGGKCVQAEVEAPETQGGDPKFFAALPAMKPSFNKYDIEASSSSGGKASLKDVLFGSVFLCIGQSNMDFVVPMVFNGTDEVKDADNYPNIRVFTVGKGDSKSAYEEVDFVGQPWAPASKSTIGGSYWDKQDFSNWEDHIGSMPNGEGFSAVCWFYGREVYKKVQHPVGLIWSSHGGTRVEEWIEGKVSTSCGGKGKDGGCWNYQIKPLLRTVISGVAWYQGESNASPDPVAYSCTFPAMIQSWREHWSNGTKGNTDTSFPFGFVQLSTHGGAVGGYGLGLEAPGYAALRWAQTASQGYAPNPAEPNVFMATAVDIGQKSSPAAGPHVQNKQDVGKRLALAYRTTVLGEKGLYAPGPLAKSAKLNGEAVVVTFDNLSPAGLAALPTQLGFEISSGGDDWVTSPSIALADKGTSVAVTFPDTFTGLPSMVRYLWAQNPCLPEPGSECPVRGADANGLPALPFVLNISGRADTMLI